MTTSEIARHHVEVSSAGVSRMPRTRALSIAVTFLVLPVIMLRMTPRTLGTTVPFNQGDPSLILWTLRVAGHRLAHPSTLFDAPIFAPQTDALAYADPLLAPAPLQRLLEFLLPGSHLVAYNVLLYLASLFNLATTFLLGKRVLGRADAAVTTALAFSFSGMALSWLGHPQLLPIGYFSLVFYLLLRLLDEQRVWLALACAVAVAATFSTSLYHGAILCVCVGVVVAAWAISLRLHVGLRAAIAIGVFAVASSALIVPTALPYIRVRDRFGFSRPLAPEWGLNPRDLVTPLPGSTFEGWLGRYGARSVSEHTYYPGLLTVVLALVGVAWMILSLFRRPSEPSESTSGPVVARPAELRLLAVAGATSFVLALGPTVLATPMPFRFFHRFVPGFDGIRVASRLVAPALLALALLAGAGLCALTSRLRADRRWVVSAVVSTLIVLELMAPIPRSRVDESDATTAVYHELASRPDGAVVELPMADLRKSGADWAFVESPRMLLATIDWKPRVNGYSGYFPPTYPGDLDTFASFPSPQSLARAKEIGVRYAVLHVAATSSAGSYDPVQAQSIIGSLPLGASAEQFGSAWLVDLSGVRAVTVG